MLRYKTTTFLMLIIVMAIGLPVYFFRPQNAPPKITACDFKIFQIGFNQCGATALSELFNKNGIRSVHYDAGELARTIYRNYAHRQPLLSGAYAEYTAFFDMENIYEEPALYVSLDLFKELDRQYPGSKFILNTGDKENWLRSRAREAHSNTNKTYLELIASKYNMSKQDVLQLWDQQWDAHHAAVIEYFKDRPDDLLVFNIEKDSSKNIQKFFKKHFKLNTSFYDKVLPYKKVALQPVRIFQLGFNKCGTTTLADFLNANHIPSVHYDDGKLATAMWFNFRSKHAIVPSKYEKYYGFFDMQNIHANPPIFIAQKLYKELDQQNPNSKFILNMRDKEAWLRSRSNHPTNFGMSYLELAAKKYNISKAEMLQRWSKEWDDHMAAVQEYFKDRPDDLLVFNIETDQPTKIRNFLIENFIIDTKKYHHKNKTKQQITSAAKNTAYSLDTQDT